MQKLTSPSKCTRRMNRPLPKRILSASGRPKTLDDSSQQAIYSAVAFSFYRSSRQSQQFALYMCLLRVATAVSMLYSCRSSADEAMSYSKTGRIMTTHLSGQRPDGVLYRFNSISFSILRKDYCSDHRSTVTCLQLAIWNYSVTNQFSA